MSKMGQNRVGSFSHNCINIKSYHITEEQISVALTPTHPRLLHCKWSTAYEYYTPLCVKSFCLRDVVGTLLQLSHRCLLWSVSMCWCEWTRHTEAAEEGVLSLFHSCTAVRSQDGPLETKAQRRHTGSMGMNILMHDIHLKTWDY